MQGRFAATGENCPHFDNYYVAINYIQINTGLLIYTNTIKMIYLYKYNNRHTHNTRKQ
jgi:hypothetical protein